jgi:hypothetical protein
MEAVKIVTIQVFTKAEVLATVSSRLWILFKSSPKLKFCHNIFKTMNLV